MFARNIGIWKIQGINALPDGKDKFRLSGSSEDSFEAMLTSDPEAHFFHIDRTTAIANLVLDLTLGAPPQTPFLEELSKRIEALKTQRAASRGRGVYLVCEGREPITAPTFQRRIRLEDFSLAFGDIDKAKVSKPYRQQVEACLIGLAMALADNLSREVAKVAEAFFLGEGSDDEVIYLLRFRARALGPYVTCAIDDQGLRDAAKLIECVSSHMGVSDITSMLVRSMHKGTNEMDRFVLAWACLEMLINKAFERETNKSITRDLDALQLSKQNKTKLEKLLGSKRQLCHWPRKQKTAIVAARLSPGAAEEDTANFAAYYRVRNDLYHEASFPERLPLEGVTDLAKKYLRLVIECEPSETPVPRP